MIAKLTTEKLELYLTPPYSPPLRGGILEDCQSGMDEGTNQGEHQQHGYYQYPSVPGHPRHVVQQQMSPARSPESFRRSTTQSVRRSRAQPPAQTQAQAPSRGGASRRRIHRSSGTAASHYGIPSTTDPLQQNVALQFQQRALSPESVRHVQSQQISYPAAQQQQQYDTGFLYGFDQSGTAQMTYDMSLPENLGGLPSGGARFGVPQQYFPSADDAESVSQYLSTQEQLAASYHQQQRSPLDRRIDTGTMAGFNPTGSLGNMQHATQQNMTNLEEAYNQYRQGIITVFGYTQRGHLNEASRLLLDLSAWLIDNARDLGKIPSFSLEDYKR